MEAVAMIGREKQERSFHCKKKAFFEGHHWHSTVESFDTCVKPLHSKREKGPSRTKKKEEEEENQSSSRDAKGQGREAEREMK